MKKKVLVLTSTFPRWDNDVLPPFVFDLSTRLTSKFEVHVLAPHVRGALDTETLAGISVHRFRYAPQYFETLAYGGGIVTNLKQNPLKAILILPFLLSELLSAKRLVKRHHIDLIHAHWIIPQGLVAVLLNKLSRRSVKILCTAHGADVYTQSSGFFTSLKRMVLDQCNLVTAVSNSMKQTLLDMGVTTSVETLPMGTDLNTLFVPNAAIHNEKQLVFVGRLVEKKGVIYLLTAFQMLLEVMPDYRLLIVGDGPEMEKLKSAVKNLNISNAVTFTGSLPHPGVVSSLQSSAIAVFPFITTDEGDQEGFGLVLVEAMGCGCAVVTTDIPTVQDTVIDEVTGLIVNQKDSQALFTAINRLARDNDSRKKISTSGRKHVEKIFSMEQVSRRYISIYNTLLKDTV